MNPFRMQTLRLLLISHTQLVADSFERVGNEDESRADFNVYVQQQGIDIIFTDTFDRC